MKHIKEIIKYLFDTNDLGWLEKELNLLFALLGILAIITPFILKICKKAYEVYLRNFANDLLPYFSKDEIKRAVEYFVPTKCQNIPPFLGQEPGQHHAFITKEKLIPFFLKKAFKNYDEKFYFVLADSGMGKTTFSLNLFIRHKKRFWFLKLLGVLPSNKIFMFPLGHPNSLEDVKKIDTQVKKSSILILDAFDEDAKAVEDYDNRLKEIIEEVWEFRKVIITCRTQFFPSQDEEPHQTGILKFGGRKGKHTFGKLYVSPFDMDDIQKFLNKKYSFFQKENKKKALRIVQQTPKLTVRPMLLNYIDDLINSDKNYYSTHQVYESLIERWIDRESSRQISESEKFKDDLFKFSRKVAVYIYQNRTQSGGLTITGDEIESFATNNQIDLNSLEMRSRSLLNRTADGKYKFSHKSILEYFLASELVENKSFLEQFNFEGMDMAKDFYVEIIEKIHLTPFRGKYNIIHTWIESGFGRGTIYIYFSDWEKNFDEYELIQAVPNMTVESTEYVKNSTIRTLERFKEDVKSKKTFLLIEYITKIIKGWRNYYYLTLEEKRKEIIQLEDELKWIEFVIPVLKKHKRRHVANNR